MRASMVTPPILSSSNAEVIPNSYIIKFKKHVTESLGVGPPHLDPEDPRRRARMSAWSCVSVARSPG